MIDKRGGGGGGGVIKDHIHNSFIKCRTKCLILKSPDCIFNHDVEIPERIYCNTSVIALRSDHPPYVTGQTDPAGVHGSRVSSPIRSAFSHLVHVSRPPNQLAIPVLAALFQIQRHLFLFKGLNDILI